MQGKLISVVIPVYRVEEYLEKCVRSVVEQTYRDLEIILVDDGSPDRCPMLCDEWAERDGRIRVIHQRNGGLAAARNAGMDAARGEFLAFVDSDDYLDGRMLELLAAEMKDPTVDIVECGFHEISGEKEELFRPERLYLHPQDAVCGLLLPSGSVKPMVWNKLYRRALVRDLRFPEQIRYGEDVPFQYQAIKRCNRYLQIPYPGYCYVRRNTSLRGVPFLAEKMHALLADQLVQADIAVSFPALQPQAECLVALQAYALMRWMFEAKDWKRRFSVEYGQLSDVFRMTDPAVMKVNNPRKTYLLWLLCRKYPMLYCRLWRIFGPVIKPFLPQRS